MDLHVLELVSDLGATSSEFVPEADGEVGPGLRIRSVHGWLMLVGAGLMYEGELIRQGKYASLA